MPAQTPPAAAMDPRTKGNTPPLSLFRPVDMLVSVAFAVVTDLKEVCVAVVGMIVLIKDGVAVVAVEVLLARNVLSGALEEEVVTMALVAVEDKEVGVCEPLVEDGNEAVVLVVGLTVEVVAIEFEVAVIEPEMEPEVDTDAPFVDEDV